MFLFKRFGPLFNQDGGGNGGSAGGVDGAANGGNAGAAGAAGAGGTVPGADSKGGTTVAAFDWKTLNLDPAAQNVVEAHQWKGPADLLGSYTNLQKAMGIRSGDPSRVLILPKDGDAPEAWNDVFTKLGRPATPEEYGLPVPDGQPKEFAGEVSKWFHELGIPKGAAVKLAERWNAKTAEMVTAQQAKVATEQTAQIEALKSEWGTNYDANTLLVDKAATAFGMGQKELTALKTAMGPAGAMKFLHTIGSKLGVEGSFVEGSGNGGTLSMTPAQAQAELARLKSDKGFVEMWGSKTDPKARSEAREKLSTLQRIAYPGFQTIT